MTDYPDNLDVRPLTTWPGALTPAHKRERSLFSATMRQTLSLLSRELYQLGAIEPGQFRLDGRPRATAKAEHPGVVLSLPHTDVGALRYATDRYLTWQDNLRAIALGLEALRKVDRYGITRRGAAQLRSGCRSTRTCAGSSWPTSPPTSRPVPHEASNEPGRARPALATDARVDVRGRLVRAPRPPDREGGGRHGDVPALRRRLRPGPRRHGRRT